MAGRGAGSTLLADIDVPGLGPIPTLVEVTPADGNMELVFAPLAVFVMPAIRVPIPAPLSVRAIEVRGDAIQVDSTVEAACVPTSSPATPAPEIGVSRRCRGR